MSSYRICIQLILILLTVVDTMAQPADGWKEEQGIYTRVYDVSLQLNDGQQTSIRQLSGVKPVVLAMIFTTCTGVCSPFIRNLKKELVINSDNPEFQLLVVSFDPRDQIDDMQAYAKRFGLDDDANWHFAITPNIDLLNQSMSFDPVWDSTTQQFDHDALLVGINTDGFITKKLLGIRNQNDLAQLTASIQNVFSPTYKLPGQSQLFSCFNYDPQTGKSTPGLGFLFIALPGFSAFLLLFGIRFAVRKDEQVA